VLYGVTCYIEHTKLTVQNKRTTLEGGGRDALANHLICGKKLIEAWEEKIMMFFCTCS
jgi:hypothetical protein